MNTKLKILTLIFIIQSCEWRKSSNQIGGFLDDRIELQYSKNCILSKNRLVYRNRFFKKIEVKSTNDLIKILTQKEKTAKNNNEREKLVIKLVPYLTFQYDKVVIITNNLNNIAELNDSTLTKELKTKYRTVGDTFKILTWNCGKIDCIETIYKHNCLISITQKTIMENIGSYEPIE